MTLKASESVSVVTDATGFFAMSRSKSAGDAGSLLIEAKKISFTDGALIYSVTHGKGKGGSMILKASDTVVFKGKSSNGVSSRIGLITLYKSGDGGTLLIEANNISFADGAFIDSSTFGKGKGGSVVLKASDTVTFEEKSSNKFGSGIFLQTLSEDEDAGDGGTLLIEANNILLTDGAFINSATLGKGNAGTVTLHANNLLKLMGADGDSGGSQIFAPAGAGASGNAGDIFIKAQDILLTDMGEVSSTSHGSGKAGNISIYATGTVTVVGTAQGGWSSSISSSSNPRIEGTIGVGGGSILVEAKELIVKDGGHIAVSSIASKDTQSGKGGDITIRVQGTVELSGVNPYGENERGFGSGIYARSIGVGDNAGDAGKITLQAGSLIIRDGAMIISNTNNNAQGGNIDIDVHGTVTITGDASNILLKEPASSQLDYLQRFSPSNYNQSTSGIYANSEGKNDQAGQGGNISFSAQNLTLTNKGKISTSSAGGGKAGNIIIEVTQLQLDSSASIASENHLSNVYDFANLAERDNHILISGDIVEIADIGTGKSGRYFNIGENLIRTTPIDTVADMEALNELTNQYNIIEGDIIEVKDTGNGESAHFIYAYDILYDLAEWVNFDDKVTVTLENMTELKTGWFDTNYKDVPYQSGEVIQVNNTIYGKPAIFIYSSGISHPYDSNILQGMTVKLNQFTVNNTAALNELSKNIFVKVGNTANVTDINSRFVFNGQNWVKLNDNLHTVANIAAMNALTIAQTGNIATIAQVKSGQPTSFVYSGKEWLPMNKAEPVANFAELNQLPAKPGDLVGVIDAGNGQYEHFFYADGKWKKQVRGGDAGRIVIKADKIQLGNNSKIITASVSGGGGSVTLKVNDLVYLNNSQISTSVQQSVGNGGDLTISSPQFLVINDGQIIAQANEGRGGNIRLGSKQFIKSPCSEISASSKLGIDGNVQIDSPAVDMDAMLVVLPGGHLEAQLSKGCDIDDIDDLSTFYIHRGKEGMMRTPEGFPE
jgi:large exoprotein involved in heme utilization and adhesion